MYGAFLPLLDKETDGGFYNRAVIIFHYEDGTSKILNSKETVRFWEDTVGQTGINGSKLQVKFNLNKADYDWKTAVELTEELKKLDPKDPVKYDFALFGLGVIENY